MSDLKKEFEILISDMKKEIENNNIQALIRLDIEFRESDIDIYDFKTVTKAMCIEYLNLADKVEALMSVKPKELLQIQRMAKYGEMESEGFEQSYNFGGEFEGIEFNGEFYGNSEQIYNELNGSSSPRLKALYNLVYQVELIEEQIY